MCVREDRCGGSKVFNLGEARHEFRPSDATLLIDQLNGRPLAIVSHTIAHQHVEFAIIILDGKDHGHGLTDFDQSTHFASPRAFTHLNLHPASDIITGEISSNNIQHIDREWPESDGFLVLIVPCAAQFTRLIPNLLNLRVELNDDCVLKESSRSSLKAKNKKIKKLFLNGKIALIERLNMSRRRRQKHARH